MQHSLHRCCFSLAWQLGEEGERRAEALMSVAVPAVEALLRMPGLPTGEYRQASPCFI